MDGNEGKDKRGEGREGGMGMLDGWEGALLVAFFR
jgi:hypothetical protein